MSLPNNVLQLAQAIQSAGGRALIVGGWVRDRLVGALSKDIDVEVHSLSADALEGILCDLGAFDAVGASFGVYKFTPHGERSALDVSLPRREVKTGVGHKAFSIEIDPWAGIEKAASRRDFTLNALAYDPLTNKVLDPFGGTDDLANGILRHTSPAFSEDPLRVLRAMQFCGRFKLKACEDTLSLSYSLSREFVSLSGERVWGEWEKWASKSTEPSMGLHFLYQCGWLIHFPELARMLWCPQDREWHPEGGVWAHTKHVCDAAARIAVRESLSHEDRVVLLMAALLHDVGKPCTTIWEGGRIKSPGHAEVGRQLARKFFSVMSGVPNHVVDRVCELVGLHMYHLNEITPRVVRRLVHTHLKYNSVDMLALLMEADHSGRPPLPVGMPASAALLRDEVHTYLSNMKPEPLVMGRHLLEKGWKPGVEMGAKLKELYELQIEEGLELEELLEKTKC